MSAKRSDHPQIIFTLTSARSGTLFLRSLFQNNVVDCACRHEPFFDWGNPTMFGPAIYDAYAGRIDRIRERLLKKSRYISRLGAGTYLESSHAFLKSAHLAALDVFPELRLIHLIRDPILVALSEASREDRRRRAHAPFHYYKGDDGQRHFCWSLTGNEEIFRPFEDRSISLFQKYIIQWIEIENRAIAFLDENNLRPRSFTLHSPADLNDPATIKKMFDFFGLKMRRPEVVMGGRRNASLGYAANLRPEQEREFREVISLLPDRYLDIFRREPYTRFSWSGIFRPAAAGAAA